MTVVGRLWRRAPAWRACVVTAVALTGLAAMFPPAVPRVPLPFGTRGGAPGGVTAARFHPRPPAAPPEEGIWHTLPPDTPQRQGIIHYAGRLLPLPAGSWQELVLDRGGGAEMRQATLFVRVVDSHLTGLMLVEAPSVMSGATGAVEVPPICVDPDRLAGSIAPIAPGQSPLTHECWAVRPVDMRAAAAVPVTEGLLPRALAQLGALHVAVPDRMLATTFVRSDDSGWRIATVVLGDHGGAIRKLQDWAARFQGALHKGYDGTLVAADLTPGVSRDPG